MSAPSGWRRERELREVAIEEKRVVVGDEEGLVWLVLEDVRLDFHLLALGDVGRVAGDEGDGGGRVRGHLRLEEEVAMEEANAAAVGFDVALCHCEGCLGDVPRLDGGVRELLVKREGDAAAACADVEEATRGVAHRLDGPVDQSLGFGAGDEHRGVDREGEARKLRLPENVLYWLVGREALYDFVEAGDGVGREGDSSVEEQVGVRRTEHGFDDKASDGLLLGGGIARECGLDVLRDVL